MLAILHAYIATHQCQEANESDDVVANVWKPSEICKKKKKSIANWLDKDFATTNLKKLEELKKDTEKVKKTR